jgi:hypothetical protein
MTSTPRLDSIAAGGTDHVFERIRLADGHTLTLQTRPDADTADEVFLFPGLTAPDTEAWENEDQWEEWLTGGNLGEGGLFLDVPVEAIRELIEQHGGEHEDQEGDDAAPEATGEKDEDETAETIATRALAAWGITAHLDEESMIGGARNTWLVVGYDQTRRGFPRMLAGPYIVLYLYREAPEEITVSRAPVSGDEWVVIAGDGTGAERELMTRPADQFAECVEAIAEWVTNPLPTAGSVLLAALARHGVTAYTDIGLSYAFSRAHLSVADRNPSIEHDPATHTGWTVFVHDENGEPIGDPLYIAGNGDDPVDCTAESAAAAAFIADWLTAPQR